MSVVSSLLSSSRPSSTPGWRINIRLAALMDSISAIAFGLGLRFLVDTVGKYDFKLTGTLVGLWEGVIMLHFLKKMPKSSDPYIGFGVRLFIDFLFTESVARLVLVLIWTALGMVLADIAPALWEEVGLERTWRHLRRDMYTLSKMVPTVAFFPPPRTVRFSPSRQPSTITEAPSDADAPTQGPSSVVVDPSIITTEQTPVDPAVRETLRRRLPGHFSSGYSDLDTEISSPRPRGRSDRTSRRLSVYPGELDTSSEISSSNNANEEEEDDLDEANRSSSSLSSATERGDPTSTSAVNFEEVPDMVTEGPLLVDVAAAAAVASKPEEGELTPKHTAPPFYMPPTPSDSAARVQRNRFIFEHKEDLKPVLPEQLPQIPDFLEEASTEDWEKIQKEDYTDEKPPTPPAKDRPAAKVPTAAPIPVPAPVAPPKPTHGQAQVPPPDDDMNGWDTLGSQFFSGSAGGGNTNINTTNGDTHTQPPAYQSMIYGATNYDDIYDDPPPGASTSYNPTSFETTNLFGGDDDVDGGTNPWQPNAEAEAEKRRKEEEDARLRDEQEKAVQEAARLKEEEEKKKKKKEEEEALKKKKEAEKAERLKKEAADAAARQKKREEEEAAEKARKEAAAAEEKRKEEEGERLKEEEAEKKKKEEQVAERKRAAEEAQARREEAARKKKEREEEERLAEEAEKKRKEEERIKEEERRKKEEEEKEKEKKRLAEEDERKRKEAERIKEEAEDRQKKQDEDKKRAEAEAESQRLEEEVRKKAEDERLRQEEERQKAEQAEAQRQKVATEFKTLQEEDAAKFAQTPPTSDPTPTPTPTRPTTTGVDDPTKNPTPCGLLETQPPIDQAEHDAEHGADDNENQDPREPPMDSYAESVATEASKVPSKVAERLNNIILLKAQMADMEDQLRELKEDLEDASEEYKTGLEEELKVKEKIVRKMQRKEQRRRGEVPRPEFADGKADSLMEKLSLPNTAIKIEEKLEQLLEPGAKSLNYHINVPTGQANKKQMQKVTATLDKYCLVPYTTPDKNNGRSVTVDIPEASFSAWLKAYRISVTRSNEND